jgi:hypothetical protein
VSLFHDTGTPELMHCFRIVKGGFKESELNHKHWVRPTHGRMGSFRLQNLKPLPNLGYTGTNSLVPHLISLT